MDKLSQPKKRHKMSSTKVVDDQHSHWKIPPQKYGKQQIDFEILDQVGITGLKYGSHGLPKEQGRRKSSVL